MKLLELYFPVRGDLMTTVRLASAGVCSAAGVDLERSEDCKVCVTESVLLLKRKGFSAVRILFEEEDGLSVCVTGEGEGTETKEDAEDEISLALLSALLESVHTEEKEGKLRSVAFRLTR